MDFGEGCGDLKPKSDVMELAESIFHTRFLYREVARVILAFGFELGEEGRTIRTRA